MDTRALTGITMGDPSGVGPEIITKVLCEDDIFRVCRPIIIGDPGVLAYYADKSVMIKEIVSPEEAVGQKGKLEVIRVSSLEKADFVPGKPTATGGKAMVDYILSAVDMTMKSKLSAMVTCPINKALMNRAGFNFEGHTELLAHLTNTDDYVMMLAGDKLRVTLVTIHCALRDVPDKISIENIVKTISITALSLKRDFGISSPCIAVAALNPHAGEEGMFGTEEITSIRPAIQKAINMGIDVTGPLPADTLYPKAVTGQYDAVVNMYHDQGLIPLKLIHFSDGVNVTLGLPIIRTSVDHGTAYDIAGKGIADHMSLKAAILMAARMAHNRKRYKGK
ncbi:MAG: 4-hydroxythreonine-4-phosphate dehydrogenase PdxA [Desulfatiglans sp.]|nr:4-hydroxythreonine-4-phosphate dehydrogenase PdxA [Desulfatiglans sp.]